MKKTLMTPISEKDIKNLNAGDIIELTGVIYTARDEAHKKMLNDYTKKKNLPFNIRNQIIYYAGPSPARTGEIIGSVGPTTSYRMDDMTQVLLELGLKGMIGKGMRSKEVIDSMKECGAVYFAATGGAGALLANHVKKSEIIAYEELGAEAIRRLEVEKFPLIVVIDMYGTNLYETEPIKYKNLKE